jgi:hypothetical protein
MRLSLTLKRGAIFLFCGYNAALLALFWVFLGYNAALLALPYA